MPAASGTDGPPLAAAVATAVPPLQPADGDEPRAPANGEPGEGAAEEERRPRRRRRGRRDRSDGDTGAPMGDQAAAASDGQPEAGEGADKAYEPARRAASEAPSTPETAPHMAPPNQPVQPPVTAAGSVMPSLEPAAAAGPSIPSVEQAVATEPAMPAEADTAGTPARTDPVIATVKPVEAVTSAADLDVARRTQESTAPEAAPLASAHEVVAPAPSAAPAQIESVATVPAPSTPPPAAAEQLRDIVATAGLQWVETASHPTEPEPIVVVTARKPRTRRPRPSLASEPLQQVETGPRQET